MTGPGAGDDDLERLRAGLYRPGASPELVARYAALLEERDAAERREAEERTASAGLAARRSRTRSRTRWTVVVVAALAVVAIAAGIAVARSAPPRPQDLLAATRTVALIGPASDAARLRTEIRAGRGDSTALVTRTAYRLVPVLRRTSRAAGNEAVLRGAATIALDGLDSVDARRDVTVLVVCDGALRYSWVLEAVRQRRGRAVQPAAPVAHGGSTCGSAVDVATVAVPRAWHPYRLRMTAPAGGRYLLSVQVTA